MAHDAFISYSSKDAPVAESLCNTLEQQGIRCWIAPRDIPPAANYAEAIIEGIEGCRVLVLVFSANSNRSPHVIRELDRAVAKAIPILPFRIDAATPSGGMEYFLCVSQWLDAAKPPVEGYFGKLGQSVRDLLAGPPLPLRPPLTFPQPPLPVEPPDTGGFVGRHDELTYFEEQLSDSGLALITGMPGVGKSSLAAALARRHADTHAIFWHAFRAGEDDSTILWSLAGFLYWQGQEDLWRMLQNAGNPSGSRPAPDLYLDYLVQALRDQAFVVCLDDFQHVEENPLIARLVQRLQDATRPGKLLVLLTARQVPPFLQDLDSDTLEGLGYQDAVLLLQERSPGLTPDLARRLHQRTGGNPQFLELAVSVLRNCADPAGLIEELDQTKRVAGYLLKQVDQCLSELERETMIAVAFLEDPATRGAIEAVMNGQRVQPSLEALGQRDLLKETGFRPHKEYAQHALLQAYYREKPSRQQQQGMHLRAGEHYDTVERDPLRAAHHFEGAGLPERAARLATANTWEIINQGRGGRLRRLLERLKPGQLDAQLWATVNISLGQVYAFAREVGPAHARFEQGMAALNAIAASPEVSLLRARMCRGISELLRSTAPQEALDWVGRGLAELAPYEPGAAGDERLDAETRAEMGREGAALRIEAGFAHVNAANFPAALEKLNDGLRLLPEGLDPLRAAALMNLGVAYCTQGNAAEGIPYYRQALDIAQRTGDQWRAVSVRHDLGIEMEIAGDWPAAVTEYQEALALAERLGSRTPQTGLTLALGIVNTKLGDYEKAGTCLRNSVEMARTYALGRHLVAALSSLADLRLRQGEPEAAATLLAEAETRAGEMDAGDQLAEIHRNWALVWLARGDVAAAHAEVERSLEWARKLELDLEEGMTLRVQGQALSTDGQSAEVEKAFERSLGLLSGRDPYEAARTQVQWGLALLSSGCTDRGKTMLQEARSAFRQLGALRDVAAVDEVLGGEKVSTCIREEKS